MITVIVFTVFVIFYRPIVDEADEICLGGEQLLEQKIVVCIASRIEGAVIVYLRSYGDETDGTHCGDCRNGEAKITYL